jgi:hypothetical protein
VTHGDPGATKLMAYGSPGNAQLGTDLAQGPALGAYKSAARLTSRSATVNGGSLTRLDIDRDALRGAPDAGFE